MAAQENSTSAGSASVQSYTLFAANGRVLVSNSDDKLVDLGPLTLRLETDRYGYVLDGNKLTGDAFPNLKALLQDIAKRITFLYLDGQFTALADAREYEAVDLQNAERLEFRLDELGPREAMQDASV